MAMNDYTNHFSYSMPASIEYGIGKIKYIGDYINRLRGTKVLVVTDAGIVKVGLAKQLTDILDGGQISFVLFSEVKAEPNASDIMKGKEIFLKEKCDIVLAIGGGSSLDSGKSIAVMVKNEGHIRDYRGLGLITNPGVPYIAIPTTSGTGAETTIWAVVSEKEKNDKYGVGSPYLVPTISVLDPSLTIGLPQKLTALFGIDALAHALESYINKATQPISETLSERAISMIAKSLKEAVYCGDVISARADMMLAATMAAMAFNPTRLGIVHALAMPLGAIAHIPHADAVAVIFPASLRFNCIANYEKFAKLAELFGEDITGLSLKDAAELGCETIIQYLKEIGCPDSLAAYGVCEDQLQEIAESGFKSGAGNLAQNPRMTTVADLVKILKESL
ncbi:MAG: alcohol dehydrogenase [Spirochaetae bacterium HGW-Spirochaetae-4]|jgi:alcohol dehydrogenase|nr:MAG: alcohol dehydrogenase [Spirochaetae bacterium HGW-Spirochaetae-8]PKL19951.1 MAG: alcohol dehydrogenase [Spirochaetae bacterium HGW-Spirochaetae-4]